MYLSEQYRTKVKEYLSISQYIRRTLFIFLMKQAYQRTKYLVFDQTSPESSVLKILTDRFHTAETATSCLCFSRVPDKNREFVPARTLFEFSTAGLRGCVTGAIVRRSSEHPRCEFTSTLLSSPFPHPGLIYFPLSLPLPSPMARGVVSQQSSRSHSSPSRDRDAFSFRSPV